MERLQKSVSSYTNCLLLSQNIEKIKVQNASFDSEKLESRYAGLTWRNKQRRRNKLQPYGCEIMDIQ